MPAAAADIVGIATGADLDCLGPLLRLPERTQVYEWFFLALTRLRSWGGLDFSKVVLDLRRASDDPERREVDVCPEQSTGRAHRWRRPGHRGYGRRGLVRVFLGTDPFDPLVTIVHEMAHIAAWGERNHHGPRWRAVYLDAARELAGRGGWFPVRREPATERHLDVACYLGIRHRFGWPGAPNLYVGAV